MRTPDVITEYVTIRDVGLADWPGEGVEFSDDLYQGQVMLHARDNESTVTLLPSLAEAEEMHAALGAAIAGARKTLSRLPDHRLAVSFMKATGSVMATHNQETVHRVALPTSDLEPTGRCLMCREEGHQVGQAPE